MGIPNNCEDLPPPQLFLLKRVQMYVHVMYCKVKVRIFSSLIQNVPLGVGQKETQ